MPSSSLSADFGFNTQPPEGGWTFWLSFSFFLALFQHTAARRRLDFGFNTQPPKRLFQHTAARRRLVMLMMRLIACVPFQHTAARRRLGPLRFPILLIRFGFNTQPPEGGWSMLHCSNLSRLPFQHTAARRRLGQSGGARGCVGGFNTQPPEGGWERAVGNFFQTHGFNTQPPEGGWAAGLAESI